MGKKNKKSKKTAEIPKAKKQKPLVTMADLEAMSDSGSDDSGMPPEEEWDADAKALKKAIEEGAFDAAMKEYQQGDDDDNDSIEEVVLDDNEGSDSGQEDHDGPDTEKVDVNSAEEEEEASSGDEDASDDNESDEEEVEDESDSKVKASSKPQHRKDSTTKDVEQSDSNEEEKDDSEVEEADEEEEADEDSDTEEADESKKEESDKMNTKALRVVTEGLAAFRKSMPWAEGLTVTPPTKSPFAPGVEEPLDIHDDLKREVAFYDIALEAALEARKKCEQAKIPFSRPDDFFAEMVKTDGTLCLLMMLIRTQE